MTDTHHPSSAPLLLLDVDGVLNALEPGHGVHWSEGIGRADGMPYVITWAQGVVDALRSWHEAGHVELQWLTTWGHDANRSLAPLVGLPELVVAGTYDEDDDEGVPEPGAATHAAVARAAPDPLTGQWWKYDVVQRVLDQHPDRLVLWVDDELHRPNPFVSWASRHDRVVALGPDPRQGLTPADLDVLAAHLGVPTR